VLLGGSRPLLGATGTAGRFPLIPTVPPGKLLATRPWLRSFLRRGWPSDVMRLRGFATSWL